MQSTQEVFRSIETEVKSRLKQEPAEIRQFYGSLSDPGAELSMEFMAKIAPPEWGSFTPVSANGEVIAYTKPGLDLAPSQKPWLFMPDSPSAGGKTTLVRALVKDCDDCTRIIKTCTTRELQPEERKTAFTETISTYPYINATSSSQYWHINKDQYRELFNAGYFLETRPMWNDTLYGIPRTSLVEAENGSVPFWFLVVDEVGQNKVLEWLRDRKEQLSVQKWFLLPTHQTFQALEDRIMFQRTEQAGARIIDAVRDLYSGASRTDVIIPYPFDTSGVPETALKRTKKFMNMLHPGVLPQTSI